MSQEHRVPAERRPLTGSTRVVPTSGRRRPRSSRQSRRSRQFGLALVFALVLAGSVSSAPAAAENPPTVDGDVLITNHSFESGTDGWQATDGSGAPTQRCNLETGTDWADDGTTSLVLDSQRGCPTVGAVSDAQQIEEGSTGYTAFATVRGRGRAALAVQFLDSAGAVVDRSASELDVAPGGDDRDQPRVVEHHAQVPEEATQVRVELVARGHLEADTVLLTGAVTNLGPQVTKAASYLAADVGLDADGTPVIFSVATGASSVSPQLVMTDAVTLEVLQTVPVPGATGGWAVRQDPATSLVYIGTYGSPALYSWLPGDEAVTKIGALPNTGAGMVYGIDYGRDGRIYGGTWGEPTDGFPGAQLWTYAPDTGLEKFGPVLTDDAFYTKAVAYEDESHTIWAGTATKGHLYGCTEAGDCTDFTDLLGPKTLEHIGVYNMVANDGYVMAWGGDSNSGGEDEITVLKVELVDGEIKAEQVAVIDNTVYYGPSDVVDDTVYYIKAEDGWPLYSYDLVTGEETKVSDEQGLAPRRWRAVDLQDPEWPGLTLVGWNSSGTVERHNIETGRTEVEQATGQPTMPVGLNSLTTGPDGRIWSAGYLTGGIGAVAPMRSDTVTTFARGGQAEGMLTHRGRIYQGTYPNGRIESFTPESVETEAPRIECELHDLGQARPYGLGGHGDRVYYGSQADYGQDVGAFGYLDLTTGECTTFTEEVGHYSVNEITASGPKVYGATNVFVAYDGLPVEDEAQLLVFDESTDELQFLPLPVSGIKAIDSLTTAPDGTVWATAAGWVFVIDPATDEIVVQEHVFADISHPDRISGSHADLLTGPDGMLYGRIANRIFSIDPERAAADGVSAATTVLYTGGQKDLTIDRYGNLYTISGDSLLRLDPRSLAG